MTYVLYLSLFGIPNWQFSVNITIQSSHTFSFENKLNIWLVPIFILVLSGKHAAGQLRHDGTSEGGTERKNGKKVIVLTICQMLPFYDYVFPTKNSFMYPNSLIRTHKKVLVYWASRWCNVNHNFFFRIFHSFHKLLKANHSKLYSPSFLPYHTTATTISNDLLVKT